jgi:rifampicin phosphotransferase
MDKYVQSFKEIPGEQQWKAGGKGGSLARLAQAGFPVPDGFVILPIGFEGDDLKPEAWFQVQDYLASMRASNPTISFVVRSSAMSEDSIQASFAGEFESLLNVCDDDQIHEAIQTVYRSRLNERVQAYSRAKGLDTTHEIAVVVQELVPAESSGVLFTANPITGRRDQAVISAAWGLGEAIVGGLVTPDTLIMDKEIGRVLDRDTADKQVMTVLLESHTQEQPVPQKLREKAVLSDAQAAELVSLGERIEALYAMPMDIEWTLVKEKFSIVQARPITALPEPEPAVPEEWKLPQGAYIAMRNNIVELMADPLTPLFATFGRQAINTSLNRLLSDFFGKQGLMPDEIIITVNKYAYYNGSFKAGQLARILMSSVGIMKYMFSGAVERWVETGRPNYVTVVERWKAESWRELPAVEILKAARTLSEAAIDAYGSLVSGVIPAAWISEAMFTFTYDKLIRQRNDPAAPTYLLGYDSTPILAEKSLYELSEWVQASSSLAEYLRSTATEQIVEQLDGDQAPAGIDSEIWQTWQNRFQSHLQRYGHMIYNLDFANPVPTDDPEPLLETCKLFLSGQGTNPYNRQQAAAQRRELASQEMLNRLKGLRLKLFRKFVTPAQRYAPLRENGLADVGLGYPLLRQMLSEIGRRFVEAGVIEKPGDIFWLHQEEVEQAAISLDRGQTLQALSAVVPRRRAEWRAARRATPPLMLPQIKIFGKDISEIKKSRSRKQTGNSLKGVAASPGRVTAPARILNGPQDFDQMQTGDVLVASITTPAWTPLFARAAAVVTDVGGPLSHGSIVAREYGIPAVLGTGSATKRIQNGQIITVDGSTGLVTLSNNGSSQPSGSKNNQ